MSTAAQKQQAQGSVFSPMIWLVAASVGMLMTGVGLILPVFARRLEDFGSGVEGLSIMMTSFAVAQLIFSPILGAVADRIGRRPVMLQGLVSFGLANIAFIFAGSTMDFIVIRSLEGMLTAGIFPAALGIVADITPEDRKARSVGMVVGFFEGGLILGPAMGGLLYDLVGYTAPFIASVVMAILALVFTLAKLPETNQHIGERHDAETSGSDVRPNAIKGFFDSLPKPLLRFFGVLVVYIGIAFSWQFVLPELTFYAYDELLWSSLQYGLFIGAYGLLSMLTQTLFGGISDRVGRRPVIAIGTLLTSGLFFIMWLTTDFAMFLVSSALAGLGIGLMYPALAAYVMDMTDPRHKSRAMGVMESCAWFGVVSGPLTLLLVTGVWTSKLIFLASGILVVALAVLAVLVVSKQVAPHPADPAELVEAIVPLPPGEV